MKVLLLIWLSALALNSANGGVIYTLWKDGAAKMPILELEDGLNGEELFNALVDNVGGYIKDLDDTLSNMINKAAELYHFKTQSTSRYFLEAVTNLNSTSPPDALDEQLIFVSELLDDFIRDYNIFYNKFRRVQRVLKTPRIPKAPFVMIKPPSRQFGDFINHLDTILDYDLDRVAEYTTEMLSMAKQNVMEHYEAILSSYQTTMNSPFEEIKGFLSTITTFKTEMEQHSSKGLLKFFNEFVNGVINYPLRD